MNIEFLNLKDELAHGASRGSFHTNSAKHSDFTQALKGKWEAFKKKMELRIDEKNSQEQLTVFIQKTQARLTEIGEMLYEFFLGLQIKEPAPLRAAITEIAMDITRTFDSLRLYYPAHFQSDMQLCCWSIYFNKHHQGTVDQITDALKTKKIDPELVDLVFVHLKKIWEIPQQGRISWAELDFLISLKEALTEFCQLYSELGERSTLKLIRVLILLNFNSPLFHQYLIGCQERHIPKDWPLEEQELAILELLQVVEKVNTEPISGYRPGRPIGQAFSDSLKKSLEIITITQKLYQNPDLNSNPQSWFYFEMAITLEDLAFDFRIQRERKMITTPHLSGVLRFIKTHIKTPRSKNPSMGYLRNLFCAKEKVAPDIVKRARRRYADQLHFLELEYKNFF